MQKHNVGHAAPLSAIFTYAVRIVVFGIDVGIRHNGNGLRIFADRTLFLIAAGKLEFCVFVIVKELNACVVFSD